MRKPKGGETQREVHDDYTQEMKRDWNERQREGNIQGRKHKKECRVKVRENRSMDGTMKRKEVITKGDEKQREGTATGKKYKENEK